MPPDAPLVPLDPIIELMTERNTLTDLRIASLTDDVAAYRLLAQQAIHALHDLTRNNAQLRERHARLCEDYRALRQRERPGSRRR
jgi:FtsZ-binding cell division protein ZapB